VHLEPSDANARRLFERGIEGPVTMLNLLRLRERADYATGGSLEFFGIGGHYFMTSDGTSSC
jgi:hypothetical protein